MAPDILLKAYVRPQRGGGWYAHCITLSIDAVGRDYDDARRRLDDAVLSYLQCMADDGRLDEMIPRPSPPRFRLEYRAIFVWNAARGAAGRLRGLVAKPPRAGRAHELAFSLSLPPPPRTAA